MAKNQPKLNPNELKILTKLAEEYDSSGWEETGYFAFGPLSHATRLNRKQVRLACRSLARKGLAKYMRGLVDYDGVPAGAGYGATLEGAAYISPCDVCKKLAHYDFTVDSGGKHEWETGYDKKTATRHRFCEEHYKDNQKTL